MQLDIKTLCRYRLERAKEDSEIQLEHALDFVSAVEIYLDNKLSSGNG